MRQPFTRRDILGVLGSLAACSRTRSQESPSRHPVADVLSSIPLDAVHLTGYLGKKLDLCIANRILAQDPAKLVEPFRKRVERSCWQSEFWGKWFLSAAAACQYTKADARQRLGDSVHQVLATQSPDGYIGNYAPNSHLKSWDIWGRKYTLLGLLAWVDMTQDSAALDGARRLADHLLTEVGPGKADIVTCGLYRGMASSSVLEPIVQLFHHTRDERYLTFARYIVSQWSLPKGPQLIEKALNGTAVGQRFPRPAKWWSWENGEKAYEMMSCYAGLLELYRETGEPNYRNAAVRTYESIRNTELNIAGSGSSQECWYGGAARQTEAAPDTMETCVAVSWMQLCAHLLRITGDSRYADEIERTAYNALLGAMTPDGVAFAKYSSLEGTRQLGTPQCGMDLNCCTANGPRGMMLLPETAIMMHADGPVVNLYSAGTWNLKSCRIEVNTGYPFDGLVDLRVTPHQSENFALRLRIPAWSAATAVTVNRTPVPGIQAGAYATIRRNWKAGDVVRLRLDLSARTVRAGRFAAVERGPLVLARDARLEANRAPDGIDFVTVTGQKGTANEVRLCDYASAGNTWDQRSSFRVWLPA
ncbi:MAG TPA: beta-L-arabinofuranosidase domain-containing protein [Bryobacteraceae bacterium]|nr:beta-L-arabinofuranosidase domain-containing protein [Bryobacteraceae bacterium]